MNIVYPNGTAKVTIAAAESIAVFTEGVAQVLRNVGYPNEPTMASLLGEVNGTQTVFGSYASGAEIVIQAGASPVYYETGTAPIVKNAANFLRGGAPVALNATGAITAAAMLAGMVTSTTAAAVAGTLPTGAALDLASEFAVGESIDWSVINTGANTFTVTAATGHTIVGAAAVVTNTSGRFRTRKTAADTFITYALSSAAS
jgi:hypothetical protein